MCCCLWYVLCTWLVCLDLHSKLPSHDHWGDLCYDVLPHQRRHVIGNPRPPPDCSTRSSREPENNRCSQNRTWVGCWTQSDTGQIGENASWGGDLPAETSEQERGHHCHHHCQLHNFPISLWLYLQWDFMRCQLLGCRWGHHYRGSRPRQFVVNETLGA